ncbi:MAG: ATP synthase F1 subunit epsilon [Polyangiaceae bacterium]
MADAIDLQIVTPSGVALKKSVTEVTGPSVAGEFGALPGHLPVLAALRPGVVAYKATTAAGAEEGRVAVAHGFAQIVDDKALLLTEKFARKEDVDIVAVRSRLKEVEDLLTSFAGEHDAEERKQLIEEQQWLAVQLELIGDPPPPIVREDTRMLAREPDDVVIAEDEAPAATDAPGGH